MLKTVGSILLMALLIFLALAQDDVPSQVLGSFWKKYPDANQVTWEKELNGYYESEFQRNDLAFSALFSKEGFWIETETNISSKLLPAGVVAAASEKYENSRITEAEKVFTLHNTVEYEIELVQGKSETELRIDHTGRTIQEKN